jgi:hypothetical protein
MAMRLLAGRREHRSIAHPFVFSLFLPFALAPILHLPVEDDDAK